MSSCTTLLSSARLFLAVATLFVIGADVQEVRATQRTEVAPAVTFDNAEIDDQDDMCIWIAPDPAQSTVITSDKHADKLFVYDLDGNTIQSLAVAGQPSNIDNRYNFILSGQPVDIVALANRGNDTIMVFTVDHATRQLVPAGTFDAGAWPVELYGFCLYHDVGAGKHYAIASGKSGQMRQWELVDLGDGTVGGIEVRNWTNGNQTEGLVADDETGVLYAASETDGIFKYPAPPSEPAVGALVAATGVDGLTAEVEGLTIYYAAGGAGYLIASSQGSSDYQVYDRPAPHDHVTGFTVTGAGQTDGIDVTNVALGAAFPSGLFVLHNHFIEPKPVHGVAYEDLGLLVDTTYWNPRGTPGTSVTVEPAPRTGLLLRQNFPNPFNPTTTIAYTLDRPARVRIEIYNPLGRMVAAPIDALHDAGSFHHVWRAVDLNGEPLPSGVYTTRLHAGALIATSKMTLAR